MNWFAVLIAFLNPICYGATNLVDAHISNNLFRRPCTILFYNTITNAAIIPFLFFFGTPQMFSAAVLPYLIIVCVIELVYQVPYFISIQRIDTSIIAALFDLGKITVPILAFLMVNERLETVQYVGYGIIIVFNLALSFEKGAKLKINSAFWLMLFSSLLLALQVVMYKKIMLELDWVSTVFWTALISTLYSTVFLFPQASRMDIQNKLQVFKRNWHFFAVNEVFNQIASLATKYSLSLLPVVVMSAIDSTQSMFVLGYGIIMNCITGKCVHESLDRSNIIKKVVCFIFIILGVVMTI